jgi:hypothetical protein
MGQAFFNLLLNQHQMSYTSVADPDPHGFI